MEIMSKGVQVKVVTLAVAVSYAAAADKLTSDSYIMESKPFHVKPCR